MKRKLPVLVFALVLALAAAASAGDGPWLTSVDKAFAAAAEGDRYVLVDLYADWCGWCKVLEREVFPSPEFRAFTRDFVLLRVDVDDGGEGGALQARYEAYSLPTTLVLDKDRVRIAAVSGYAPAADFLRKLEAEMASYRALVAYYETTRTASDLATLQPLADELHARGDGRRAAVVYERMERRADDGPRAAWLRYLTADAYRLAGLYDKAAQALGEARRLAPGDDGELGERVDLLSYQIAQDSGDCEAAEASLVRFLEAHPASSHRHQARQVLEALRKDGGTLCA